MAEKRLTHQEMVDEGVKVIIRAFGKGEDLHGAVWQIVTSTAMWTEANLKAYAEAELKAKKKKGKRK